MRFHSMRWQLAVTYGAIVLLTALTLGAVLLVSLRDYYRQHESEYLRGNAQAISTAIASAMAAGWPTDRLEARLTVYAFFAQVRARLYDADENLLVDTGLPQRRDVVSIPETFSVGKAFIPKEDTPPEGREYGEPHVIVGANPPIPSEATSASGAAFPSAGTPITDATAVQVAVSVPPLGTWRGFGFYPRMEEDGRRSSEQVRQAFYDQTGKMAGTLLLSDGPAYGLQIVDSVARGWAIAGGLAVLLAGGVGWFISRRLSEPLQVLGQVTTQMAEGDLSVRAPATGNDEVGQLARSFNEMATRVEATVTTLRSFAADAAHELNTPLTALQTELELATQETNPQAQEGFIARALEQSQRLSSLCNDLLDLSRIESGTVSEEPMPLDLVELVAGVSEFYASWAEQRELGFALHLPTEPIVVEGVAGQLRRAAGNLLDNALKFSPDGGTIDLSVVVTDGMAQLVVENTGSTIPPEDLPHIFRRFHRGRNAASYPGSGLGLAMVRAIAARHGGNVRAENSAAGVRVILTLPLRRDEWYNRENAFTPSG